MKAENKKARTNWPGPREIWLRVTASARFTRLRHTSTSTAKAGAAMSTTTGVERRHVSTGGDRQQHERPSHHSRRVSNHRLIGARCLYVFRCVLPRAGR